MPRKKWAITEDFSQGYSVKRDVTQLSPGALIYGSWNVGITDGDRIAPRGGSERVSAASTDGLGIKSQHTFKKRSGLNIELRSYGTVLEYYHPGTESFENLNSGYTTGQRFGFADHNVNTDGLDYVYFCNAVEPYSRWSGAYSQLDGALTGGETEVVVDSTLTSDVFDSGTASSVTATTLTVSGGWATDLWNDFYVRITSGAQSGKVSKISATTSTTITFTAISGLSGTPTYEIRQAAFEDSGTLRIGTTDVTYTSIDQDNRFAGCSSTPAASDDAAIAQAVTTYPANPRGNIFLVKDTRMLVSGVKKSPSSVYYSKIADATDFTFASPRNADDGGVIDTPEGGGAITGLGLQEQSIYMMKEDIIKTLQFTQDGNDLPIIDTLIEAPQVGPSTAQSVFYVDNQLYYASKEGGVKSISRVREIDFVQSLQLSDAIVELVNTLDFSNSAGIFFEQKGYISARRSDATQNDIVLVYNYQKDAWEAPIIGWNANAFNIYNGELHWGDSYNSETWKFTKDIYIDGSSGGEDLGYLARARFAFNNYGEPAMQKKVNNLFLEGYISGNTTLTIRVLYNDRGTTNTIEANISGSDDQYLLDDTSLNALGTDPLGTQPLGITLEDDNTLSGLAKFRVYFPLQVEKFYEVAVEIETDEAGAEWEILRYGFDTEITPDLNTKLKKSI